MANFARIINSVAVDVSADPKSCFTPDLAERFVQVPDCVTNGWRLLAGDPPDGEWQEPPPPPTPPAPVEPSRAEQIDAALAELAALSKVIEALKAGSP